MHGVGHHHHIHAGFDGLGHQGLQRHGLDRQAETGHFGHLTRVASDDDAQFATADVAFGGLDPADLTALGPHAGHLALLDDVHAHGRTGAGIAPGHGVMARGAAARLPQRPQHRIARAVDVQDRAQFLDAGGADEFGHHPLQRIGMGGAQIAAHLMVGLGQHHDTARREHDVVVQILAHRLVQRAGLFIDRGGGVLQIVRPDDRGVAAGVAAAKPALFDDGDIGDAVVLAKVIGRGQPVAARADDDRIVGRLGCGRGPGLFPAQMMGQRLAGQGKDRIAFHGAPFPGLMRAAPT